jgi:hypothetical protein
MLKLPPSDVIRGFLVRRRIADGQEILRFSRFVQDFAYDRGCRRYVDLITHSYVRGKDIDELIDPLLWPFHHTVMKPSLWLMTFGPRLSEAALKVKPKPSPLRLARERVDLLLARHGAVSIAECAIIWNYKPYRTYDMYETSGPDRQVFLVKKKTKKKTAHALIRARFALGEDEVIYDW